MSLFDSGARRDASLERPLPENISEAPPRERLRWEKELLGLYLSDHPLGELAGVIGEYVTAYSGELGEELDQQRICVGGVVTEIRKVVTKSRATMGVATLEDLQGTIEVIVFPKVLRADRADVGGGRDPARCRPRRPQGRGDRPARRRGVDLGRGASDGLGRVHAPARTARSRPASAARPSNGVLNGNGNGGYNGNGYNGNGNGGHAPFTPARR